MNFAISVEHWMKIKENKENRSTWTLPVGHKSNVILIIIEEFAHGVMVIVVGNGHGDTSSNPGRGWLHFT